MLTALVFALVTAPSAALQLAPELPAGANGPFLKACRTVETKLAAGDFAGARAALALLPKTTIVIDWDAAKLPAKDREQAAAARDKALEGWKKAIPAFKWSLGKQKADIQFSFVPTLPPNPDSPTPAGAVQFSSPDPKEPRIEVVIALKRGANQTPQTAADIQNEVSYALAMYYGASRNLGFGTYSTRTEDSTLRTVQVGPRDAFVARDNLKAVAILSRAVQEKTKLKPAFASMRLQATKVDGGEAVQGQVVPLTLQVANLGNSTLRLRLQPDCGCFLLNPDQTVPANGGTALLKFAVDTTEFVGPLSKQILLYSNDPDQPIVHVTVELLAKPLYRFLPAAGRVALAGPNGGMVTTYFIPSAGSNLDIENAEVEGLPADVTVTPWEGMLADPEMGEGEQMRKGYKIVVDYEGGIQRGRTFTSLTIKTNAKTALKENGEKFELLSRPIFVQVGILAMPESLRLGEIPKKPQTFHFLLTRPDVGFAIQKITSDSPFFKASFVPIREDWEYRVTVEFTGKADYGQLAAKLTILTSDKREPPIVVPISAVVR